MAERTIPKSKTATGKIVSALRRRLRNSMETNIPPTKFNPAYFSCNDDTMRLLLQIAV